MALDRTTASPPTNNFSGAIGEDVKIEHNDSWFQSQILGERVDLIVHQLRTLKFFRDDGRVPSQHLLDDIKVFEFILNSQDPPVFAKNYFEELNRLRWEGDVNAKKMDVAKNLGWEIK